MSRTTSSRSRRLVGAGVLALAAMLPATVAFGRPPPSDDPPIPPEPTEPPPPEPAPEPEPMPTPPPPTVPREVQSFSVATDSVVAHATIQYNGTPPSLIVYWGDNTVTELTPPPANQVVLRHDYAPPADGAKFSRVVNATVRGETDSRLVTITPRYRITQHEASFANEDNCEHWPDDYSEWDITQNVAVSPGSPVLKAWYQERPMNHLNIFEPLQGSEVIAEREAGALLAIGYEVRENDEPGYSDPAGQRNFYITPDGFVGTEHLNLHFNQDDSCEARIEADVEIQLIVPLSWVPGTF